MCFFSRETWRTPVLVLVMWVSGRFQPVRCLVWVAAMLAALCSPRRSFQQGSRACFGVLAAILCRDDCRVADPLRLVEALPLSERLGHTPVEAMPFFKRFGHTVLAMLGNLAATFCKVSEVVLLAWGGCENIRLLAMSELALRAWGMQNSPEKGGGAASYLLE